MGLVGRAGLPCLGAAVLCRAAADAAGNLLNVDAPAERPQLQQAAQSWLSEPGLGLRYWCLAAGVDVGRVIRKGRELAGQESRVHGG